MKPVQNDAQERSELRKKKYQMPTKSHLGQAHSHLSIRATFTDVLTSNSKWT